MLKVGGEAMIPYLARLLLSQVTGKKPSWFLFTKLEIVRQSQTTDYLRQVWEKSEWFYEGQYGFRPVYSCESQTVTVWQDIADSLDEGERIDAIIIDFSKAFDLVPHDRLLTKIMASGVDSRVVAWVRQLIPTRSHT
jgi:hypothetical protein